MTTTTEKKVTKKGMFNKLLAIEEVANNQELVEFINHEIELLERKASSKSTKPTKTQIENEGLKATIIQILEESEKPLTISEISSRDETLEGLSTSKISALLVQLRKNNLVVREYDKKTAIFRIAVEGETSENE